MNHESSAPVAAARLRRAIIPRSDHPRLALRASRRMRCGCCTGSRRPATRPSWSAAACATSCSGVGPRTSTSPPTRCPTRCGALFRNCRLVGRRFRLAHVVFGREIIEVATFRAASAPPPGEEPMPDPRRSEAEVAESDGAAMTTREFDRARGDVERRRGAIRASRARRPAAASCATTSTARSTRTSGAAISPPTRSTTTSRISRSGITSAAWRTSQARRLRLIGDPETRYREDPVRMLRAARFEAKLGFTLDAGERGADRRAARRCSPSVPAARLFDETLKLFLTGHGARESRACCAGAACSACCSRRSSATSSGIRAAWWSSCWSQGLANTDAARGRGQAGDADVPVRAAAVRPDRGAHRDSSRRSAGTSRQRSSMACDARCARRSSA